MRKMGIALLAALLLLTALLPAAAMAAEMYTVNYEYPVTIYKTSNKVSKKEAPAQETYEAGKKVTLPLALNGVYEAADGRYYEILGWEDRTADSDVWTYVSQDKYGRRYLSFIMPEYDVTFGALIDERYIVEYTNLDGEDEVFECTPGEATPPYGGGSKPERSGFSFFGWSPKVDKTVTKSQIYTAIWEAIALSGKKETVEVREELFQEAVKESKNDTIVLNMEKAQEEHDNGANDKKIVTAAKLDQEQLETIVDSGKELAIEMSTSTVTLDKTAIAAINEQLGGRNKLEVEVYASEKEELSKKQQKLVGDRHVDFVLTANIIASAGDKKTEIHDFKGGEAEIRISYTLPSGRNPNELVVYYFVNEDTVEEIKSRYENGYIYVTLKHFSDYYFTFNVLPVDLPQTGDGTALSLWLSMLTVAAAAVMLFRKREAA